MHPFAGCMDQSHGGSRAKVLSKLFLFETFIMPAFSQEDKLDQRD
jgi:hypothetical protein